MVINSSQDKVGKIVALIDQALPYQERLLAEVEAVASAIVVYRDRTDAPGQGMYYITYGFNESRLNVPVVEAFEPFSSGTALKHQLSSSPNGVQVSIWPQDNPWKKANDVVAFQLVWNVILSAMQMAKRTLALPVRQWHSPFLLLG